MKEDGKNVNYGAVAVFIGIPFLLLIIFITLMLSGDDKNVVGANN